MRRADPEFETKAVAEMLAETDTRLALLELETTDYAAALDLLDEANEAVERDGPYAELLAAVEALVGAEGPAVEEALGSVQQAIASFAAYLAANGRYCDALEQIERADSLRPESALQDVRAEYAAFFYR